MQKAKMQTRKKSAQVSSISLDALRVFEYRKKTVARYIRNSFKKCDSRLNRVRV
jgi:hypothetical protein